MLKLIVLLCSISCLMAQPSPDQDGPALGTLYNTFAKYCDAIKEPKNAEKIKKDLECISEEVKKKGIDLGFVEDCFKPNNAKEELLKIGMSFCKDHILTLTDKQIMCIVEGFLPIAQKLTPELITDTEKTCVAGQ